DNFNVYSIKIEGILIETCSFFDSLCQVFIQNLIKKNHKFTKEDEIKEIHEKLDAQNRRKHFNIQDYEKLLNVDFCLHDKAVILSYAHPLSTMYALYIQRTSGALGYRIQPFSDWAPKNSPFWWKAFTDLKHDRMTNFKKASLRNTIYALAAVFII